MPFINALLNFHKCDDFQTPPIALKPLIRYLKKEWVIWECASGRGILANGLRDYGFTVIETDIIKGYDFCIYSPLFKYDCIITNPPYSLKQEFLERCYQLGKPFALLLPISSLETQKRIRLFDRYGVELILFDRRINFITPSGRGSGAWFGVMWVTSGMNIGSGLTFSIGEI